MSHTLLTLLTFGAGATTVAGIYSIISDLFLRDRQRVTDRIDDEFRNKQRSKIQKSALFKDLSQLAAAAAAETDTTPGIRGRFDSMVEQSGLDLSSDRLLLISLASAIALLLFGFLVSRSLIVAGILGPIGFVVPIFFVNNRRKARQEKLLSQLPDAFDLMSRVVRAGQSMAQALQAVANEFPRPISIEFGYCYEQQNLGLPTEIALRDLARRNGVIEIQIFVMAVLVQQQTGGNLAELLDKLSSIIRTRYKLRGQVKSLTAEGRMQAAVLLALPPAMFVLMLFLNPKYALTLFEYPSLLFATVLSEGLGALWIRQIVNFDF